MCLLNPSPPNPTRPHEPHTDQISTILLFQTWGRVGGCNRSPLLPTPPTLPPWQRVSPCPYITSWHRNSSHLDLHIIEKRICNMIQDDHVHFFRWVARLPNSKSATVIEAWLSASNGHTSWLAKKANTKAQPEESRRAGPVSSSKLGDSATSHE